MTIRDERIKIAETGYTPEQAGYLPAAIDTIDKHLLDLIDKKRITAGAYLISKNNKIFAHRKSTAVYHKTSSGY